jgi:diguanylate cyclase (GGDEF)-like protein
VKVPIQQILLIVAAFVAGLLVIGALLALPRREPSDAGEEPGPGDLPALERRGLDKYAAGDPGEQQAAVGLVRGGTYGRAVRVAWLASIAALLVGIGLSGAFSENQPLIYAVGAVAIATVLVLHELLPARWRLPGRAWIEALIALALVTAVVFLTGGGDSPFVIAYPLVTVGVALASGAGTALVFAAVATLAYVAVVGGPPPLPLTADGAGELLRMGANVLGIWLVTGLAAAYAAQERRARSAFLQISLTDPLTGLFNRSQIYTTLDQEIRRTRRSARGFCILMIDLDGLKAVNDTFGHHHGDDVLRHLGTVIRRSIRTVDTAYRYGGDEFVVLLPETDIVGAFVVAEKIRAGTQELGMSLGIDGIDASVSIGLVSHPEDGFTVEELMIAADRAMYQAKSLGKNQISGYPRPRRLPPPALPPPAEPTPPPAQPEPIPAAHAEAIPPATAVLVEPEGEPEPEPEPEPAAAVAEAPVEAPAAEAPATSEEAVTAAEAAPTQPAEAEGAPAPEEEAVGVLEPEHAAAEAPTAEPAAEAPTAEPAAGELPREPVAAAATGPTAPPDSELRPVEMAQDQDGGNGAGASEPTGEEEPDPSEVRRQIASASRSFDPDHQIRRAMDAFLGPMTRDGRDR